jgi:F-type H+-transporting ATPase subunit epsilon
MSNGNLNLKIITPSKVLVDEQVDAVYSVASDGEFGVLSGHISLMSALDIGVTKYVQGEKHEYIATIGGILKVKDNTVTIITDSAEKGEEIDLARANAAKERAEARLGTGVKDIDTNRAQIALARAAARIKAASHSHHI